MQASYLKIVALTLLANLASADSNWKWSVEGETQLGLNSLTFPVGYQSAQHLEMWSVVQNFELMAVKEPSVNGRVKTSILPDEKGKQYLQVDYTLDGNNVQSKDRHCRESDGGVTCSKKVEVSYLWPMDVTIQREASKVGFSVVLTNAGKTTQIGTIGTSDQLIGVSSEGTGSLVESKDTCKDINAVLVDVMVPKGAGVTSAKIDTPTQADRCKDNLNVIYTQIDNGVRIFEFSK